MAFNEFEKLSLIMLCDIYEKVGASEVDPSFVREAIMSGNSWAIEWEYPGIFPTDNSEEIVSEVVDILDMWTFIEDVTSESFDGFDGNNEGSHCSVARMLTEKMDRFTSFAGRTNHGVHQLPGYRKMLTVYKGQFGGHGPLSATAAQTILAAR